MTAEHDLAADDLATGDLTAGDLTAGDLTAGDLADTMVLFDWNGTIVLDGDRALWALNGVLERHGVPLVEPDEFSIRFKLPMDAMFLELGVDGSQLAAAESEWNTAMASRPARLRPGVLEALSWLSSGGAWLGIVSAASEEAVRADLRSHLVAAEWEAISTAVSDKPAELSRHRPGRERAYYVGDTVYDMESARSAGYVPIAVVGGYGSREALEASGAEYLVHDLRELQKILAVDSGSTAKSPQSLITTEG